MESPYPYKKELLLPSLTMSKLKPAQDVAPMVAEFFDVPERCNLRLRFPSLEARLPPLELARLDALGLVGLGVDVGVAGVRDSPLALDLAT